MAKITYLSRDICNIINNYLFPSKNNIKKIYDLCIDEILIETCAFRLGCIGNNHLNLRLKMKENKNFNGSFHNYVYKE